LCHFLFSVNVASTAPANGDAGGSDEGGGESVGECVKVAEFGPAPKMVAGAVIAARPSAEPTW
jgi:hypothetical protein